MHLVCVSPDMLDAMWPIVRGTFERAYAETDQELPDVLAWLKRGEGTLWVAVTDTDVLSALTVSLEPRPSGLVCRLVANGGHQMDDWLHLLGEIEAYAKAKGCVKMTVEGRRGWQRVLREYKVARVILEKVL